MALLMSFAGVDARTEGGYRLVSRSRSASRRLSSIPVQDGVAVKDLGTGEGTIEVALSYHRELDDAPVGNLAQPGVWEDAQGKTDELSFGRHRFGRYLLESIQSEDSAFIATAQGSAPQVVQLRMRFREVAANIRFERVA